MNEKARGRLRARVIGQAGISRYGFLAPDPREGFDRIRGTAMAATATTAKRITARAAVGNSGVVLVEVEVEEAARTTTFPDIHE